MTPTRLTSRQMRETGWNPADESWSYASADAPTYVITVPSDATTKYSVGMRIELTQPTDGVKYFIVTAVSATTLTVYGGTDYDLDNEAITSPSYSVQKAPLDFPLDPDKWTEKNVLTTTNSQASPTTSVWYNLGENLAVPIGSWFMSYSCPVGAVRVASTGPMDLRCTLSTGSSSQSDAEWTSRSRYSAEANAGIPVISLYKAKVVTIGTKATYYMNASTPLAASLASLGIYGDLSYGVIRAVCAYL